MKSAPRRMVGRAAVLAMLPLAAACTDRSLTLPRDGGVPAPQALPVAVCRVNVTEQSMVCTDARKPAATRAQAEKILGGQEIYVRLSSSGTEYDAGTQILSSNVTVQNLLRQTMGIDSTNAMVGVRVFFQQQPTVIQGSGNVSIQNADGMETFTESNQPYFLYNQEIAPYQISTPRQWLFSCDVGVTAFEFTLYVSAPLVDSSLPLLDHVWKGSTDANWDTGTNWNLGAAPDSGSTVAIPVPDSVVTMPVLSNDAVLTNLRVAPGSTLGLGGKTLVAWGIVDGVGVISDGTIWSRGTGTLLGGFLPSVRVTGSASLQRPTVASGAVSVSDGSLTVKNQPLSIQIP